MILLDFNQQVGEIAWIMSYLTAREDPVADALLETGLVNLLVPHLTEFLSGMNEANHNTHTITI